MLVVYHKVAGYNARTASQNIKVMRNLNTNRIKEKYLVA